MTMPSAYSQEDNSTVYNSKNVESEESVETMIRTYDTISFQRKLQKDATLIK